MRKNLGLALIGLSFSVIAYGASFAEDSSSCKSIDEVKQIIQQKFPNAEFKIEKSPISCVYEIWSNIDHVLYTDGNYFLIGHVVDFSRKDLTQDKIDERVTNEALSKLNKDALSNLFKVGNGPVEIVEFTDPECSYCREVEQELEPIKDKFTRYVAFMPFPSNQNSKALIEYILCNGTEESYKDAFEGKVDLSKFECPAEKKREVENVIENHLSLSREFGIKGTPTFIVKTSKGYRMVYGSSLELLNIIEQEYKK